MELGQTGYRFVQSFAGNEFLDQIMVFSAEYLLVLVPLAGLYIWFNEENGFEKASFMGATVCLSIALTYVFGLLYYHQPPQYQGFETILTKDLENAFPSQHGAGTFAAIWPALYLGKRKLAGLLTAGAVLTGIGRVYTGLHFPIDILGGVLVSLTAFAAVYLLEDYLTLSIEWLQTVTERFNLDRR
ncbi:phosphatase PAP2 family protein [Candidatus Nanohalococcus occultus]|uniref:phosphatase PAP2 family protein n=1 Tax=Candidatus Nanohalococcus occultus TaxID=2978047 RepID=UPI0039E0DE48